MTLILPGISMLEVVHRQRRPDFQDQCDIHREGPKITVIVAKSLQL